MDLSLKKPIVSHGPGLHVGDYFTAGRFEGNSFVREPSIIEGRTLDVHRSGNTLRVASPELEKVGNCACGHLDISWLPFAAERYHTSADIRDYVLVDVPIVVANFPNRNMDAFTYQQLTDWRTPIGRVAYQTFIGKPAHKDHDNMDDTKAKGIIFDASLVPFRGRWHVKILKGFDRSKDQRLANLVQKKNRIGHSMGALVERTECSLPWCKFHSDGRITCDHVRQGAGKGERQRGHLVYENMLDFYFVESSSVEDPAYVVALSDKIWG
jgi:hypothetical protein